MRKVILIFVLLLLPFIALYGCGSGGSTAAGDSSTVSKTGSLVVAAKFPQNGKHGQIGTALIDENTASILVEVYDAMGNYYPLELTPDTPADSISDIAIGSVYIYIYTYDSLENMLDYMEIGGRIEAGENYLVATLIRGGWSFVNTQGAETSIILNKTFSEATDTLTSFWIIPDSYYYAKTMKKATIDDTESWGSSYYGIQWNGSGLSTYCDTTGTCSSEVDYLNQFIGPSTNNNALDGGYIELTPNTNYPDTYDEESSNRYAFFFGLPVDFYEYGYGSASIPYLDDPDLIDAINTYATTMVTASDTITGYIIEMLSKSYSYTVVCYDVNGVSPTCGGTPNCEITCPGEAAKVSTSVKKDAVRKAISRKVGKAQADAQGCFRDLSYSETDSYTDVWDLDGDLQWDDPMTVEYSVSGSGDACGHAFIAKGSQIP
jgi:hypothetical protein